MPNTPDTKSWTWVLERACPECGFVAADLEPSDVDDTVRKQASTWTSLLEHPRVRDRPNDDQRSALEYGCHVRDVFRLLDLRLGRMLDEHEPRFANWDQNVTAVEDRYDEQDPAIVAVELRDAAEQFAERLGGVPGDQWSRVGLRSDGAVFTVESFAPYLIQDPVHHVHDVEAGNESLAR